MKTLLSLLLLLASTAAFSQGSTSKIRVCTYNVLSFSEKTDTSRWFALQTVIGEIQPDVLVLQEINGPAGLRDFYDNAISNPPNYRYLPLTDGYDTENALLYNPQKIELIGYDSISTDLRRIDQWTLHVLNTADTLHVFGCHLKAGDEQDEKLERTMEMAQARFVLDELDGKMVILAGDLNAYGSNDPGYAPFLTSLPLYDGSGQIVDTLYGELVDVMEAGSWHSNEDFSYLHSQSTRVREFGGGTGGGLADRFDFVLMSHSLQDNYVAGSYTTFGNDGNHFNDSINSQPNTAVSPAVAQALYDASDHLPVYADFEFSVTSGVEDEERLPNEMKLTEATR